MYLISPNQKQYKANLHSHTNLSDATKTPHELKEMYKEHGYSILSITDHERPKNHSYLNDDDFLLITGYEAYIRKDPNCIHDVYGKEIHLNLYARKPENEAIICYNPKYCKYMTETEKEALTKLGSQKIREYSVKYINEYILAAKQNGYIVAYNHPWWSTESEADILSYEGLFSLKMCNYSCYQLSRLEYNAALYDKMLKMGKRIFCHSCDDNHNIHPDDSPKCDSFGAFTMIMPKAFTYDSVIQAMESGEMYSSMGPIFNEISLDGRRIHIECSEVERIMVFTGSKEPISKIALPGEVVSSADFEIDERAEYIRVSVVDKYGRFADTRGFFRDELDF